jgi:hypothetical protein
MKGGVSRWLGVGGGVGTEEVWILLKISHLLRHTSDYTERILAPGGRGRLLDNAFYSIILSVNRDSIFKLLRSPGIASKELIPPAYVAWRAGTATKFLLGSQPPMTVLKF